jgi:D-alanyl-D-alanine carboxypeptidase
MYNSQYIYCVRKASLGLRQIIPARYTDLFANSSFHFRQTNFRLGGRKNFTYWRTVGNNPWANGYQEQQMDSLPMNTLNEFLSEWVTKNKTPGLRYVALDRNGTLCDFCGGASNIAASVAVTPETRFLLSSCTKVVTAVAVLQLVDQGLLKLNEALTTYFPEHPYGDEVQIRHLLSHTSGVPNPFPLRWLHTPGQHGSYSEDAELHAVLAQNSRLKYRPGSQYMYSNVGYWLLGKVIESCSGISYAQYIRENIFARIGAVPQDYSFEPEPDMRLSRGYFRRLSLMGLLLPLMTGKELIGNTVSGWTEFVPAYMNGPSYGGLFSTAAPMAAFLQDLLKDSPTILSTKSRDAMLRRQTTSGSHALTVTLGWNTGKLAGVGYFGKPGGGPGFQSSVRIYPDRKLATIYLMNCISVSEKHINSQADAFDTATITLGKTE